MVGACGAGNLCGSGTIARQVPQFDTVVSPLASKLPPTPTLARVCVCELDGACTHPAVGQKLQLDQGGSMCLVNLFHRAARGDVPEANLPERVPGRQTLRLGTNSTKR